MNNLTPELEQKSRNEFEAHYKTFGLRFDRNKHGDYDVEYVDDLWQGWEARHKTICVELPYAYSKVSTIYQQEIIESLQAAGIGVKS